jgi:hypothetical protein
MPPEEERSTGTISDRRKKAGQESLSVDNGSCPVFFTFGG